MKSSWQAALVVVAGLVAGAPALASDSPKDCAAAADQFRHLIHICHCRRTSDGSARCPTSR